MSRYTQGYIPPNLGKISFLDGRIQMRNIAEFIVVLVLTAFPCFVLSAILPKFIIMIIIITGISVSLIALAGVGGEPLSIWLFNIINYSNSRTYATLRPPQREVEGLNVQPEKNESRLDSIVNGLFTGGKPAEKKETPPKLTREEKKMAKIQKKQQKRADKFQAKANARADKFAEKQAKAQVKARAKMERKAKRR